MGGANQIWNSITVYPLWVTMAVGAVVFGTRMTHWIGYDQVRFLTSASCGRLPDRVVPVSHRTTGARSPCMFSDSWCHHVRTHNRLSVSVPRCTSTTSPMWCDTCSRPCLQGSSSCLARAISMSVGTLRA